MDKMEQMLLRDKTVSLTNKEFYDLGVAEKPFRISCGSMVKVTEIHKKSSKSQHYVGMEMKLEKALRRWRCKEDGKMYVTAMLRPLSMLNGMWFSYVRFESVAPSTATLYRQGFSKKNL